MPTPTVDRYAGTLQGVFKLTPCVNNAGSGQLVALAVTLDAMRLRCSTPRTPAGDVPRAATDDHPFPYLRQAGLPPYFWARLVAGATVAFMPIFLANLVFAGRYRDVSDSTGAFGANLLGAMLGGLIEYVALVNGYQTLLLVVAALYGLAWWLGQRGGLAISPAR